MKRKTMKRILSVCFAVTLLLCLSACGKTIGTGGDKPEGGVIQESVIASPDTASTAKDTKDNKETKDETTTAAGNSSGQQANTGGTSNTGTNTGGTASGGNAAGTGTNTNSGGAAAGSGSSGGSSQQPTQTPTEAPTQPPTEAPTQPPTEAPTEPPAPTWTISVSVDAGVYGGVFGGGTFTFYYQPTAFDALVATGLSYTGSSYYVSSINGLAEFDHGRYSGWLYAVNGYEPNVGCGSYYLNNGDYVYWHYQGDE